MKLLLVVNVDETQEQYRLGRYLDQVTLEWRPLPGTPGPTPTYTMHRYVEVVTDGEVLSEAIAASVVRRLTVLRRERRRYLHRVLEWCRAGLGSWLQAHGLSSW